MVKFFKSFFLTQRFFIALIAHIIGFILSFFYENLLDYCKIGLVVLLALLVLDILFLYAREKAISASRVLPDKWSNGDLNPISIRVISKYAAAMHLTIIDELPDVFQKRDFKITATQAGNTTATYDYQVRPVERGEYHYGGLRIFVTTYLGLARRRFTSDVNATIPVYPSFLQMRKFELMAFTNKLRDHGLKKIRRIGHTMEFEQIKDYVHGDDVRNINWKASAKRNQLMINQFQDEKSQPVYSIIDKGRVMKMPFEGLKLLDYAINATLVISNIALKKGDKAGMMTFSHQVEHLIQAQKRSSQMNLILETLYNVDTNFIESDFSRLYIDVKRRVTQRSLLLLYTNFETLDALHRQLPYLQALSRNHLLVVVFFENTELKKKLEIETNTTHDIVNQTIAQKFAYEKKLIVQELNKYGIQTILTTPQNLTVNTINKYLEIKARGQL